MKIMGVVSFRAVVRVESLLSFSFFLRLFFLNLLLLFLYEQSVDLVIEQTLM